jgi:hypothetical protein
MLVFSGGHNTGHRTHVLDNTNLPFFGLEAGVDFAETLSLALQVATLCCALTQLLCAHSSLPPQCLYLQIKFPFFFFFFVGLGF